MPSPRIVNLNFLRATFRRPSSRGVGIEPKKSVAPLRFFIANGSPIAMTTRYRCAHLSEQLGILGHESAMVDWWDETKVDAEAPLHFDVIVLYRLMMSPALARLISAAQRLGKPVIFDTDDLIFEPELIGAHRAVSALSAADQELHARGVQRYLETLLACDCVITSTPFLAELVRRRGKRAFVHRNALGTDMLAWSDQLRAARPARTLDRVVIGYGCGTHTHDVDFLEAAGALEQILQRFRQAELWLAGPLTVPSGLENFGTQIRRFPLADWRGWFELESRMDLALAPLELGNDFCRAKSEVKFVEAGALGVPTVASRIDPYQDAITEGRDGLLVAREDEWVAALSSLIEEAERARALGAAARATILQRYSPGARAADLAAILPALINAGTLPHARLAMAE